MARFFKPLTSGIRSLLSKLRGKPYTKPTRPSVGVGHRGVAIGSRENPDLSPENIAKWKIAKDGDAFVYEAMPFFVHSTNVNLAQYFYEEQKLMLEFRGNRAYIYSDIPPDMAIHFFKTMSKGSWVWDFLRVRGTVHGYKKPYSRLGGGTPVRRR